ncbi:hypothetical protein OH809_16890 [Streptomyces sp. NBC_00873]|uniref:hypothetical protein n=1 Tax=unclassified Streptomyces TaxID=2593676 RepID=UPI00386C7274|nr:hypothetical protein OH809_16890 [Streptomyces sp. NBC_00873]WTA45784.1 hypothetical protein OH821_26795 [Streptomyces sp. NBC_00842]
MSVDASLHVRWRSGESPSMRCVEEALSLNPDAVNPVWLEGRAADRSRYGIRISVDAGDLIGATANPSGCLAEGGVRRFDVMFHVSPTEMGEGVEDGFKSLRAYCREIVSRLRDRWEISEYSFGLDFDGLISYKLSIFEDPLPAELSSSRIDLWIGSQTPLDAGSLREGSTFSEIPVESIQKNLSTAEGNEVLESLERRIEDLSFQRAFTVPNGRSGYSDRGIDGVLSSLASVCPGIDVAVWVDGLLCRYEVELEPIL